MDEYLEFKLICSKCKKEFIWKVKKKNFRKKDIRKCCSRKCANSKNQTFEMNLARSNKLKGKIGRSSPNKGKILKPNIFKKCENIECSNILELKPYSKTKYCLKCRSKFIGGYREGSGRSKNGYYKGIYCGSTYELIWVIYNLDHNIKFDRFPNMIEYNGTKYIPDFIIDNTIYEIKGYCDIVRVNKKCDVAINNGYNIVVLYKKDIQYMFDYVTKKYNTKKYYTLYDEYAPKFRYICGTCGKEFYRDKESRKLINYCSRKCGGKYSPSAITSNEINDIIRFHSEGYNNKEISNIINRNVSSVSKILMNNELISNGIHNKKNKHIDT
jgi:hypothetical protein